MKTVKTILGFIVIIVLAILDIAMATLVGIAYYEGIAAEIFFP